MTPKWDGKSERRMNDEHMTALTEIKVDVAEMRSDMKHILEWGAKHDIKDDIRFKEQDIKLEEERKFRWTVGGVVIASVFIINIFMKVIVK